MTTGECDGIYDKVEAMFKLYNSLSKKIEEFRPISPPRVGMYACGPTVYDYAHIGHGRKYVNDDLLKRALQYSGFQVKHVENITDVGHLVSDGDEGEDKMEKGAKKAGKTVWEVAEYYTRDFFEAMKELNIEAPAVWCKATDHINDQIVMIEGLIKNGHAYETEEAVYFDVLSFPDYGRLFGQAVEEKQIAVREEVSTGEHKRHPADFALWFKRVGRFADHQMHWDSPWGDGFPGWHIECSAMSMKYLGEQLDIHTGGEDHLSIHHPNEIAQSEGFSGKKPFVKYWVHHAFLMVDGQKMSKSLGNFYRIVDIKERGIDPLALRYFYLSAHYRKQQNFTFEALDAAAAALLRLRRLAADWSEDSLLGDEENTRDWEGKFVAAVENDLNAPEALAVMWEMTKSNLRNGLKLELLEKWDQVLGLNISVSAEEAVDETVTGLVKARDTAREKKDWQESDRLRQEIMNFGYTVEDTSRGTRVRK